MPMPGVEDRSTLPDGSPKSVPGRHRTDSLSARYREVRRRSLELCDPLSAEDCAVQSMPDASPAKWHLAHATWFFETLVLGRAIPDYVPVHPQFGYLFNSYYDSLGPRHDRPKRDLLTRPSLEAVRAYRTHVDAALLQLLADGTDANVRQTVELGLHHEQQHQELILTDVKHLFGCNPLRPAYRPVEFPDRTADGTTSQTRPPLKWISYGEGLAWIGHDGEGFAYDNESPHHRVFLRSFRLAGRLVTADEYLQFIDDGGYRRPELWLSDGWEAVQEGGWEAPLYWECRDGRWQQMTLGGMRPVHPHEPVCHVSYYEADAYARWAGCRLPTEVEWETAAKPLPVQGHFVESGRLHPLPCPADDHAEQPAQMFGNLWEWTASPYVAFPGYRRPEGPLGEYNGKFLCNQFVLRGGSCATPAAHIRPTYRNFFPPEARWQFSGIRLAQDDATPSR